MPRHVLRFALLFLAAGCSGGTTPQSTLATCDSISTEYAAAIQKAEECTIGTPDPCTKSVAASFFCQCTIFVAGDTASLAEIHGRFTAAKCQAGCTGSCAMETAAKCQADATSATGARCLPVAPDAGP